MFEKWDGFVGVVFDWAEGFKEYVKQSYDFSSFYMILTVHKEVLYC